ncbi:hypothetical protein JXA47_07310 [Candidatus Sumerlaeota bacterium]|nr:hypothetical protein [Candidatus Sumerlaeota bacterium]
MKSRLFSQFDPVAEGNKELERHLKLFINLEPDKRKALIEVLPEREGSKTKAVSALIIERLQEQIQRSSVEIGYIFRLLRFFLEAMIDEKTTDDTEDQWAEDLGSIGFLSPPEKEIFIQAMSQIREAVLPSVVGEYKRRLYGEGVFPTLSGVYTTVELRAVQDKPYALGTKVEDYQPQIHDTVGVVSIRIRVDSKNQSDFCFQMTEAELDILIDALRAAKTDLSALHDSIVFQEKG